MFTLIKSKFCILILTIYETIFEKNTFFEYLSLFSKYYSVFKISFSIVFIKVALEGFSFFGKNQIRPLFIENTCVPLKSRFRQAFLLSSFRQA